MNSAATYKSALHKKKTYLISVALAVLLFVVLMGIGVEQGVQVVEQEVAAVERDTSLVPFEQYFVQYAPEVGWEWQLLAAVAYHESRFNSNAVSYSGARGVMQLMPKTGARFGLNDSTIFEPEDNIAAAVRYIKRLQQQFSFIPDSAEQTKFVLASYNAGPAHIHDARRLAKKYGDNPNRWSNVEYYMEQLRYEEYYTDSVVQFGSFNADETAAYVRGVMHKYETYKKL